MSTATLEEAEAQVARDPDTVGADLQIIRRHLRRKIGISWENPVELDSGLIEYPGTLGIGGNEWKADLQYRPKYDVYRFRFFVTEKHSNAVARRFDVQAKNPYTLCNDLIAVHSTLMMIAALDLEKE